MKGLLKSKVFLTLITLVLLASAIAIPLSGSITHSHAASAHEVHHPSMKKVVQYFNSTTSATNTDATFNDVCGTSSATLVSKLNIGDRVTGTAQVTPDDPTDTLEAGEGEDLVLSEQNSLTTKLIGRVSINNGKVSIDFTAGMAGATNDTLVGCIDGGDKDEHATVTVTVTPPLVIVLQGINTALNPDQIAKNQKPGFTEVGGVLPFLRVNGMGDAKFMPYSYNGVNAQGQLQPYFCEVTFNQSLRDDEFKLDGEITSYLKGHPNTNVYLIGHSLGGVVAFGYLAFLRAFKFTLPDNGKLAGVITLDAPIGGVSDSKSYFSAIKAFVRSQCDLFSSFESVKELMAIFKTAPSSHPQGGKAGLKQVVFGGKPLTNQQLADEAKASGIPVLTIGNTRDFLWDTGACPALPNVDFRSTQVLSDEGFNSGVYGRVFQGGDPTCKATTIVLGELNHLEVLTNSLVDKAILDFLPLGTEPDPLKPPTKGF